MLSKLCLPYAVPAGGLFVVGVHWIDEYRFDAV